MSPHAEPSRALERGRQVLAQEAGAVAALASRLDQRFADAVDLLLACRGRVIVSGIGKSGLIARKVAATLTSTGSPATFLHAVDSVHGDLGIVGRDDAAILISKSGETDELFGLVAFLKRLGVRMIAITGALDSTLARQADVTLDASVSAEACPLDLAPTTSTTVALALGDALAVALFEAKGFKAEDFARLHPGGSLGRRLLLLVRDVMVTDHLPALSPDASMRECVILLAERRGTVAVVGPQGIVIGVVTAGDLTRLMEKRSDFLDLPVGDVMTRTPKLARPGELASSAVNTLEKYGIMAMPVVDDGDHLVGIVHLHDLMRAGAV
jgi:arabinose-5-phosphate isomerase